MSLLITKSPPGQAASYTNHFKDTFEIKPNSQIAVQEATINRRALINVSSNAFLAVYHGKTLAGLEYNDIDWGISLPIPEGTYEPDGFAATVQTALNLYEYHPVYAGNWVCAPQYDLASQEFTGVNIAVKQTVSTAVTRFAAADVENYPTIADLKLSYDAATGRATRASTGSAADADIPGSLSVNKALLATGGSLVVKAESSHLHGEFEIFLGRKYGYDGSRRGWYDYVVRIDILGSLTVNQALVVDPARGPLNLNRSTTEIQYWNDPDSDLDALAAAYDWDTDTYNCIKFTLDNQRLALYVGTDDANYQLVTDKFKPITFSTYALYPELKLKAAQNDDSYVDILGMTSSALQKPNKVWQKFNVVNLTYVDMFIPTLDKVFNGGTKHDHSTLSRGLLAATQGLNNTEQLVVGRQSGSKYTNDDYPNMQSELGFSKAVPTTSTNKLLASWTSDFPPLIRLTGLTFESLNGTEGVNGPSRILQPISRFTDNKSHGMIRFVPPERTYLNLNNPNKLTIHSVQVEVVDANERLVTDLTDNTFVIFHIR